MINLFGSAAKSVHTWASRSRRPSSSSAPPAEQTQLPLPPLPPRRRTASPIIVEDASTDGSSLNDTNDTTIPPLITKAGYSSSDDSDDDTQGNVGSTTDPLQQVTPPRRVTQSPFRPADPTSLPYYQPPTPISHLSSGVPSAIRAQVDNVMAALDGHSHLHSRTSHRSTPFLAEWNSQPSTGSSLSDSFQTGVEGSSTGPSLHFSKATSSSRARTRTSFGDGFDSIPMVSDHVFETTSGPVLIIHEIPPCGYSSQFLTTIINN
ncbi:hypothetical protein SEMRO_892_G216900.1 [Seminavis robusta]|uniref:Uncharacterized protein n=1 Tax=Seminavis robusta TaxID=568900 RepID=A0A9N8EBR2_9STRA|nr:hypothetical protein SEMRO_892_G216900.1 [Seminavis robusta]|eukprot:Sro892_g216900.1 n/a (263) ;mRNA; r:6267-7055